MKKILMIIPMLLFVIGSVHAAGYIKFDGIDGEATDKGHDKWISVESFSWGMSNSGSSSVGGGGGAGKVSVQDLSFTKTLDKSSPKLQESLLMGTRIPKLEFEQTFSDGKTQLPLLKYELENVMISSYSISSDGEGRPVEQITLNFEKIKMTYTEYDKAGKKKGDVSFTWDLKKGTK